jgi:hypothetical protein
MGWNGMGWVGLLCHTGRAVPGQRSAAQQCGSWLMAHGSWFMACVHKQQASNHGRPDAGRAQTPEKVSRA